MIFFSIGMTSRAYSWQCEPASGSRILGKYSSQQGSCSATAAAASGANGSGTKVVVSGSGTSMTSSFFSMARTSAGLSQDSPAAN